jgi:hypothetical protein
MRIVSFRLTVCVCLRARVLKLLLANDLYTCESVFGVVIPETGCSRHHFLRTISTLKKTNLFASSRLI